jgi:hypothetical protein
MDTFKLWLKNRLQENFNSNDGEYEEEEVPISDELTARVLYTYQVDVYYGQGPLEHKIEIADVDVGEMEVFDSDGDQVPMLPEYKQIALKYFNVHLKDMAREQEHKKLSEI